MIKAIHPEETFGTDFSPVAEITAPVQFFKKRGLKFAREADDLDVYEYSAFMVEGCGMMVLQHYLNIGDGNVNLLLADNFEGLSDLAQTLKNVAEELGLPAEVFHWRQNGEEVSFIPSGRVAA